MKLIIRTLLSAIAVVVLANILDGVSVNSYVTAIIVAVVLSVLQLFVKPILVILTLPITIVTLGLFLFIINAIIVLIADKLISGFSVTGLWSALVFSILLSISEYFLFMLLKEEKK